MIKFCSQKINKHFKMQNTTLNILRTVDKTCDKVLKLKVEHDFNNKRESRKFSLNFLVEKSYNKSVNGFNF